MQAALLDAVNNTHSPNMSEDVYCLSKAYNMKQKSESGIRLGDNVDTQSVSVRNDAQHTEVES